VTKDVRYYKDILVQCWIVAAPILRH